MGIHVNTRNVYVLYVILYLSNFQSLNTQVYAIRKKTCGAAKLEYKQLQ